MCYQHAFYRLGIGSRKKLYMLGQIYTFNVILLKKSCSLLDNLLSLRLDSQE